MIVITTPVWIRLAHRNKLLQTMQFIILSRKWNNVVANKSWFTDMYFSVNLALGLAANDEVLVFFKWDLCLYIVKLIICFFSIIACDIYICFQSKRVGLLDADVYGPSLPTMMNVNEEPELNKRRCTMYILRVFTGFVSSLLVCMYVFRSYYRIMLNWKFS